MNKGFLVRRPIWVLMYADGEGVTQDNVYAHMWWNIAASNGHAVKNRDIVAMKMTAAPIEKAQNSYGSVWSGSSRVVE